MLVKWEDRRKFPDHTVSLSSRLEVGFNSARHSLSTPDCLFPGCTVLEDLPIPEPCEHSVCITKEGRALE